MRTKRLGNTDLNLSVIGFGAWAIGGSGWKYGWGFQDDKESIAAILRAVEKGVNWIDTAAAYGLGHSEEVVGKAIRELSTKPIIAAKCSRIWDKNGNLSGCLKGESIRQEVEASLKRLNIDVIDLYQIHWPNPDKDIEEAWSTIADLIKGGKLRYGGVSNFSVEQLKRIQSIHPIASLQPPYSMLRRDVEDGLLDYCAANKIGVIVYSPMQKGLLTGKFSKERVKNLPVDDHRRQDTLFQEPQLDIHLQLVDDLRPIAERNNKTLAQLALSWVLRRPEITAVIVGTRNPSQIEETAIAGDWLLSEKDIADIDFLLKRHDKALKEI
ncbi:MAG: aldo/keto reductase [Candidatus Omnitrophica bacterium]|nr:aldo/keto reductase [Candidatus Omnitrophota bacterium]